ncbi:MAG: hypothetical protein J7L92_04455 [Dehalococcoidia bacterium]|nr:hypothetical protein [Dehalococcoidia bacterium]
MSTYKAQMTKGDAALVGSTEVTPFVPLTLRGRIRKRLTLRGKTRAMNGRPSYPDSIGIRGARSRLCPDLVGMQSAGVMKASTMESGQANGND